MLVLPFLRSDLRSNLRSYLRSFLQNRRLVLPVPLVLAFSLIFVYLAASNFEPLSQTATAEEIQIVEPQNCLRPGDDLELDSVTRLPSSEKSLKDCDEPVASQADLWPRSRPSLRI